MDGVGEDFSGLPERRSRREREGRLEPERSGGRSDRYRGRRTRTLLAGGFAVALLLSALSLIVAFAPSPYLGMSHGALASSVGDVTERGCRPSGDGWVCWRGEDGSSRRYKVRVDWAGCWNGQPIDAAGGSGARPEISGCVSILDHLTAE